MKNYNEIVTKAQVDVIAAVKQIQDASLAGFQTIRENTADLVSGKSPATMIDTMPNPAQVIENAFGFTAQILELQKGYALKVAESLASAVKSETHKFEKAAK
jgi:hypothetical protein